jgi:hypothetical protein
LRNWSAPRSCREEAGTRGPALDCNRGYDRGHWAPSLRFGLLLHLIGQPALIDEVGVNFVGIGWNAQSSKV